MGNKMNRREFFKSCATSTLGSASALAGINSLTMMSALADTEEDDYRALVCVFLYGGNDSHNMLIPKVQSEYNQYAAARENLAIPFADVPTLNSISHGNDYGFSPYMPELRQLFADGNMAVLANVGALVEPTTREQFLNNRVQLPPRLFSHNDQQDFWQSLKTDVSQPHGWAGRMADLMGSINGNSILPMNISLFGSNLMQSGQSTIPYHMSNRGVEKFALFDKSLPYPDHVRRVSAFDALMDSSSGSIFGDEYAKVKKRASRVSSDLDAILEGVDDLSTAFAEDPFSQSLKVIANTIAARESLGLCRQIFFVGIGGWDTHANQLPAHAGLLTTLSKGLSDFYQATVEMGVANEVTTFTASDFGRTLGSNGDGSDHGWSSHQLIMGGAVKGRDIYGQLSNFEPGSSFDAGRGRLIPTTSIDQYVATLASWYGLSAANIAEVFPHLSRFDNPNLGFI
jgi:uncharacterized protein (DUF1501 family)